ncbi:MAG: SPASM domain-containing protein, partial [Candidatus Omnitrophica bacterium]|nr:SPASM domain-containing protein [Candidatus Omnitrophota bacterium]
QIGCNHIFHCGAGLGSFTVGYDGFFRLCSSLGHPDCIYDLRKGSLKDAWENFVFKVRDMRSKDKEFLDNCHRCALFNLCRCCPAHAYLETGKLDAVVEYFCKIAHSRAEKIFNLPNIHLTTSCK